MTSSSGVAVPAGNAWGFEASPGSRVQFAALHPLSLVAADETATDRFLQIGSNLFVPGEKAADRLDAEGRMSLIFPFAKPPPARI